MGGGGGGGVRAKPARPTSILGGRVLQNVHTCMHTDTHTHTHMYACLHTHVQGDNSPLTKRNEKVLQSEQIVWSRIILNQIPKLRAREHNVWKLSDNNV